MRLPGKNVKPLHNRPLLAYSVLSAVEAKRVDAVYVSTDSDEIGACGESFGATYLQRPSEFSGNHASTTEVLQHAVSALGLSANDIILTLQPTNPFRPVGYLDAFLQEILEKEGWSSAMSVSPLTKKIGTIQNGFYNPDNYTMGQRTQDMEEKYFFENGLLYATKVSTLASTGNMFGADQLAIPCREEYANIDIDTLSDFLHAEELYPELRTKYNLI